MTERPAGRYRRVLVRLWSDQRFVALDVYGQRLALYCITGPQTNRLGFGRFSIGAAAEDLGATGDELRATLEAVCAAMDWTYDPTSRVLWVRDWWEHAAPDNASVLVGALKDLAEVPACDLRDEYEATARAILETLQARVPTRPVTRGGTRGGTRHQGRGPHLTPPQDQDQDQDQKQDQDPALLARWRRFWSEYPRKTGQTTALAAFRRINPDDSTLNAILAAVREQAATYDWQKDAGRYVPTAARWLEADPPPWAKPARRPHGCTHRPYCADDDEHSRRFADEMRQLREQAS